MRASWFVLSILAQLWTGSSLLAQVSVRVDSDRPGAILYGAENTTLGELPLTLSVTTPTPWESCVSLGEFRARWADGIELGIGRIEVCPEAGTDQEILLSLPSTPAATPLTSADVCHEAGLAYKPVSSLGCDDGVRARTAAAPAAATAPTLDTSAPPTLPEPERPGGSRWRTVGRAAGAFFQGWLEGAAATAGAGRFASSNLASSSSLMLFGGSGHDTFLGCVNCSEYDPASIFNSYGAHGSRYSAESVTNPYSDFGSRYSSHGACNPYAADPPVIVDSDGGFHGRLTLNRYHHQRTRDSQLLMWLTAICTR